MTPRRGIELGTIRSKSNALPTAPLPTPHSPLAHCSQNKRLTPNKCLLFLHNPNHTRGGQFEMGSIYPLLWFTDYFLSILDKWQNEITKPCILHVPQRIGVKISTLNPLYLSNFQTILSIQVWGSSRQVLQTYSLWFEYNYLGILLIFWQNGQLFGSWSCLLLLTIVLLWRRLATSILECVKVILAALKSIGEDNSMLKSQNYLLGGIIL